MSAAPRATKSAGARFSRCVEPEWLDELPANDPRAIRSRRDLVRVNWIMRNEALLRRALDAALRTHRPPRHIVELGAGDGGLLLRLARRRARDWPNVHVTLLDMQPVVANATLDGIRALGWSVAVETADVLDWLGAPRAERDTVMLANLFVHHFEGERLARLLRGIAAQSRAFVCCEPLRSRFALTGSHLLGLIGCNDVTRHDAVLSVRAGFRDRELSVGWRATAAGNWRLAEGTAGMFSHLFSAARAP